MHNPLPRRFFRFGQIWTESQRRVVIAIVLAILAILSVQLWLNPAHVDDPPSPHGSRFDELQDRLDPNTADAAALAAIPMLGEKRAKQIVEYREAFSRMYPERPAFARATDLEQIKGIGPATVATMEPYLLLPSRPSTTPSR
jgi:Helix-hairpin-helix motif